MSSSEDDVPLVRSNARSNGRAKGPGIVSKAMDKKLDKVVGDVDKKKLAPGIPVKEVAMADADAPRGQRRARKPAIKEEETEESEEDMPLTKRRRVNGAGAKKVVKDEDDDSDVPLTKRRVSGIKKDVVTKASDSEDDIPLTKKRAAPAKRPLVKDDSDSDVPIAARQKLSKEKKSIEKAADKTATKIKQEKAKPAAKKIKTEDKKIKTEDKKIKAEDKKTNGVNGAAKGGKKAAKTEEEEEEEQEEEEKYKWWKEQEADDGVKWTTLEHNGVLFPPEYVPLPSHVKLYYDGKPLQLHVRAEEVATFFGSMLNSTVNVENPVFCANFFADFQAILKETGGAKVDGKKIQIKEFKKLDFKQIFDYYEADREAKRNRSAVEKKAAKAEKDALEEKYLECILDGRKEKVGNFRVEPPGLFRGRGSHPKTGKVKQRVMPEQVTINIGKGARVPSPPPGHKWAKVIHDNTVTWLATWKENINGNIKYVMLAPTSSLKSMSDFKKFEKARELKQHVKRIRDDYTRDMKSKVMEERQRATAIYFIDKLALRAGNEKSDDEADTVGCCSLRCEHIFLEQPNKVTFDFLGKDSIRYQETVEVDLQVFKNLYLFKQNKNSKDELFDRLTTPGLNKHLNNYMPGLTAKVFRTYNASWTMAQELKKFKNVGTVHDKVLHYNSANRKVAILCNHQRTVGKGHDTAMEKLEEKMREKKYKKYCIKKMMLEIKPKLANNKDFMDELRDTEITDEWIVQHHEDLLVREKDKIEKKFAKDNEKLVAEGQKEMKAGELEKRLGVLEDMRKQFKKEEETGNIEVTAANNTIEKCQNNLKKLDESIAVIEAQMLDKEENKSVALGTSKLNYIDPRLTVMFCKKFDVPIEKVFSKTLRDKFEWAIESADENWDF